VQAVAPASVAQSRARHRHDHAGAATQATHNILVRLINDVLEESRYTCQADKRCFRRNLDLSMDSTSVRLHTCTFGLKQLANLPVRWVVLICAILLPFNLGATLRTPYLVGGTLRGNSQRRTHVTHANESLRVKTRRTEVRAG